MSNERLFSVYRRDTDPGKPPMEWAAREDGGEIEICFGVSGRTAERVRGSVSVWGSFEELSESKAQAGYVLAGFGDYPNDRLRLLYEWDPERNLTVPVGTLNWVACKAIEQAPFEALMERIREGLTGIGVSAHLPGSRDGERPGLVVETLTGEWAISLQPNGTLTDRGRTGPGRVPPAAGTLPMVALLRIEREFPGTLEFVWNSNRSPLRLEPEVDPEDEWLGTTVGRWDDTVAAAGAVGLIPAQVLREQERDGPTPMWF